MVANIDEETIVTTAPASTGARHYALNPLPSPSDTATDDFHALVHSFCPTHDETAYPRGGEHYEVIIKPELAEWRIEEGSPISDEARLVFTKKAHIGFDMAHYRFLYNALHRQHALPKPKRETTRAWLSRITREAALTDLKA